MSADKKNSICFVGLENIPVLAPEYNQHGIGGEQVQQTLIAKVLAKNGYLVSMVVGDYGQKDGQSWHQITTYKAYRFGAGLPILRFLHPRLTGMWGALKRANADIYYTSCAGMQVGIVALFAKIYKRRMIFRTASDSDCEPENLLIRYRRDKKLYEYGLRSADCILVQSEKQQVAMWKNYHRESEVAGMLVDGSKSAPSLDDRDIDVLWVSNIRQLKRPDLLLALAKSLPTLQIHMVGGVIGGSESLYSEMQSQAATVSNLKFHGQIPYHDIGGIYNRAKVFVNTSDIEGFPNSYLQAWIHGAPVITFLDPDGIIAREGLGFCVTDLEKMKSAIMYYMNSANEWHSASERCLNYMRVNYSDEKIIEPYIRTIDQLANQPRIE